MNEKANIMHLHAGTGGRVEGCHSSRSREEWKDLPAHTHPSASECDSRQGGQRHLCRGPDKYECKASLFRSHSKLL